MFKTKYSPFNGKLLATSVLVLAYASNAVATPAAPATKASEPLPPPANIATITDLSLKIKVAEKQKQLREIQAVAKPVTVQVGLNGPVSEIPSISVLGANRSASLPAAPPPPSAPPELAIQSINSIGGKYTALSNLGRDLTVGSRFNQGSASWHVISILGESVGFQKCVKGKCAPVFMPISY
jgi:hypothetical protein